MNKKIVIKSNKLIEANYKLTLQEQRLILILAKEINREDKNFKKITFTVEELSNILDLDKKNYYSKLKEVTKSLISRVIQIKEPKGLLQVSWLSSAQYIDNEGTVELGFSDDLKPYLLQLGKHFTKLEFNQMVSLTSIYAIRIYELLKQYEKIKVRKLEIEELREILQIKNKYKKYNDFKKYVLLKAQEEINEKTDINITFEEIKTGRKVTSIKFKIKSKVKEIKKSNYEKEIEEKIRKQNKKLNENTFVSDEKIDFENLTEKEKEFLEKARLIAKKES